MKHAGAVPAASTIGILIRGTVNPAKGTAHPDLGCL